MINAQQKADQVLTLHKTTEVRIRSSALIHIEGDDSMQCSHAPRASNGTGARPKDVDHPDSHKIASRHATGALASRTRADMSHTGKRWRGAP